MYCLIESTVRLIPKYISIYIVDWEKQYLVGSVAFLPARSWNFEIELVSAFTSPVSASYRLIMYSASVKCLQNPLEVALFLYNGSQF